MEDMIVITILEYISAAQREHILQKQFCSTSTFLTLEKKRS